MHRDKKETDMTDRSNELVKIELAGVEEWREYDFNDRVYRVLKPTRVEFRDGGATHRVTDLDGIVHCLPAPGVGNCVLRWKGPVVA
jgi:hypothetical protein